MCLVNNTITADLNVHLTSSNRCKQPIRTCCSCMRNSYINPVKCYTCGETVEPFINDKWGAILVAGCEKAGEVWRKEIDTFKDVITSKVVPAMCISSDNVFVIGSDTGTFKSRIDDAFAKLMNKNIRTLLFMYSGHKEERTTLDQEGHIQVGPDKFYSLKSLSDALNEWNSKDSEFEKVIAFLDCCYSEKLDLKDPLKLIQFNATSPEDAARANKKDGSLLLKYISQALTGRANGDKCKFKRANKDKSTDKDEQCKCSDFLLKDFITLEDLSQYLNAHINTETEESSQGYSPHLNYNNIDSINTIIAYNYQFEVKFKFKLDIPGSIEDSKSILIRPREFNKFEDLKLKLATEVMKNVYVLDPENSGNVSQFADILSIEFHTGPWTKHIQEIDSVETLVSAWNSKRELRCTIRPLKNMSMDKPVGWCLRAVPGIRNVHKAVLQECNIMDHHWTKSDLLKYSEQWTKREKNDTGDMKEFSIFLDMLSHLHKERKEDIRFDISFF